MLKKIRLERFKNFKEAELTLGNSTILVGTNATGKSNIGDALRFLHGISRGYNLAEILGEKWGQGGFLEWEGIRGGKQNITFQNSPTFAIEVTFSLPIGDIDEKEDYLQPMVRAGEYKLIYRVEVNPGINGKQPKVIEESLYDLGRSKEKNLIFKVNESPNNSAKMLLYVSSESEDIKEIEFSRNNSKSFTDSNSIKNILKNNDIIDKDKIGWSIDDTFNELSSLKFLDLFPDAMRRPSNPGQNILGDRGENLSSVLQGICENPTRKRAVLEWLKALTPMDATDLEFVTDITGKILLVLIEANGQKIPIISASDGTLRFLAMIAALFNESDDLPNFSCYFLEELDNGLHPTRLHLLIELIETRVKQTNLQIIATTHSSQLLRLLSYETLQNTSLTYRLENQPDARIKRIFDISPETETLIKEQSLARLHESGWLENIMESAMKTLAKWSIEDYHQMVNAGILCDRKVELLAGEIIEMSPESPIHYNKTKRGVEYLATLLTGKADIRFNGPISLSDSEPEPDIAIVRPPESRYDHHHPYSEDIFWIIEVAKSSLKKDLELKLSIYAQARIAEYWVLDLSQKQLIVFRNPENNIYLSQQIINQGMITSLAFPDIEISVERLLS